MLAPRPLSALSIVSVLVTGTYSTTVSGYVTVPTWKDWTCPPPETTYLPVTTTENYTYTTAVTETVTLYQTIIETEVVNITTPTTAVLPTTVVETELETITQPVTLTATLEEKLYSSTEHFTSLKLCPTRIINPTFTVAAPFPTDWTWGCPAGWLCKPKQDDCNFEVGLPDRGFYCAPNECIPAEALPAVLQTWNTDPTGNLSALDNPALGVNIIDDYFNMNPTQFGLTYEIFVVDRVVTFTSTTLILPAPSAAVRHRQAQIIVPPMCYDWCNNCLLEAQSTGKTPDMCKPESAFETSLLSCLECIAVHHLDVGDALLQISPQFQQFMDYCDQTALVVGTSATVVATVAGEIQTSVVPTTSVTIVATLPSAPPASTVVLVSSVPVPAVAPSSSPKTITTTPETSTPINESTVPITTTATLPTTVTSLVGGETLTGSQLSQITIVMPAGNGSSTAMAGSDLSGATIIFAGNSTSILTSSYLTTYTSAEIVTIAPLSTRSGTSFVAASPSPSGSATTPVAPSASEFTGAAGIISPHYGPSWLAALIAGLLALL